MEHLLRKTWPSIPRSWFPKIFANTFFGKQDFRKTESWACCFFANCSWKINYSESEIQIPHDSAVVVHTFCTFTGQWRQAPEVFVGQRRLACLAEEVESWVGQKPFHLTNSQNQKTLFKWCRDISGHEISQHILTKKKIMFIPIPWVNFLWKGVLGVKNVLGFAARAPKVSPNKRKLFWRARAARPGLHSPPRTPFKGNLILCWTGHFKPDCGHNIWIEI